MNERFVVRLEGGPFDGETRLVTAARAVFTEQFDAGLVLREGYGDQPRLVALVVPLTYRRTGDAVFTFCRTQAGLGDIDRKEHDMSEEPETVEETEETEEETVEEIEQDGEPEAAVTFGDTLAGDLEF